MFRGLIESLGEWGVVAASLFLAVAVHELGHALAGAVTGYRIRALQIGTGPRLVAVLFGSVSVRLHLLPLGGLTLANIGSQASWLRLRLWVLAAGGPAANLAVFFAIRALVAKGGPWYAPSGGWMSFATLNLVICLLNLVPMRHFRALASDGLQLATIPFWSRHQVDEARALAGVAEVLDAEESGDRVQAAKLARHLSAQFPDQGHAAMLPGLLLHHEHQHEAARAVWLEAVSRASARGKVPLQNAIAFADAVLGTDERVQEAQRLSGAALAERPQDLAVTHTRGAVLVRIGRWRDGLRLLTLMPLVVLRAPDRAYHHAFVAIALAGLGQLTSARRNLQRAREADPGCTMLAEVEAAVQRGQTTPSVLSIAHSDQRVTETGGWVDARALRSWRRWARVAVVSLILFVPWWYANAGVYGPLLIALLVAAYPERSALLALGASWIALAAQEALGLGALARTEPRLATALLAVVAAGISFGAARWRREVDASAPRMRWLIGGVVGLLSASVAFAVVTPLFHSAPTGEVLRQIAWFVPMGTLLMAHAALLFAARHRLVAVTGIAPAALAVFLTVLAYAS
jgi:hypothetical protein